MVSNYQCCSPKEGEKLPKKKKCLKELAGYLSKQQPKFRNGAPEEPVDESDTDDSDMGDDALAAINKFLDLS
jgi:hypothetical protein